MILKGLGGKVYRFFQGRYRAITKVNQDSGIPEYCLTLYPPMGAEKRRHVVVFYSGDGGWANLTTTVASELQKSGLPVIGIDCMQYFWNEKTPQESARDFKATTSFYLKQWNADRIVLLGYSMGADVLPITINTLSPAYREKIDIMFLLSPSKRVELKFRFIGWLGYQSPEDSGVEILPDIEALAEEFPVVCLTGENETESLACSIPRDIAEVYKFPGGHHYRGDYLTLAKALIARIDKSG